MVPTAAVLPDLETLLTMNGEKDTALTLLRLQMNEIYFVENQLVTALEMNARAATDEELISAFRSHRTETIQHVHRVEAIFKELGTDPKLFPSQGLIGTLDDAKWMMWKMKGDRTLDPALAMNAQKVENFEISCYQAALALARSLSMERVMDSCETILEEEKNSKRKLRQILSRLIGDTKETDRKSVDELEEKDRTEKE